jgi:hypothetical protein
MKKDAAARATIVAALERQLKKGDKSLVGNKGYRRFLADPAGGGFAIDRAKVEEDAKFDGVFVLRTNASLSPLEAMFVHLWMVERAFRTSKSLFETPPDLSQTRRDDPRPRRVQLPRARPEKGAGGSACRGRHDDASFVARRPRRSRLADRDRGRAGRQALPSPFSSAPRRKPRLASRRRRLAAYPAPNRRRTIHGRSS